MATPGANLQPRSAAFVEGAAISPLAESGSNGAHAATGETARPRASNSPRLRGELQGDEAGGDHVVATDDALVLDAEDLIEIDAAEGHEGRGGIGGGPGELGVEGGQEAVVQIAVGGGDGGDAGEAELVDQAPLQGAIGPLTAAAGLRGVAQEVLDAEAGQRTADLSGPPAIDGAAGGRRVRGPVGAIGVEGHGQAVTLEDGAQGGQDGGHALAALGPAGVEHALGGVIDDADHREPLLGHQSEPAMPTAVEVQPLAATRARLAAAAVAPAR